MISVDDALERAVLLGYVTLCGTLCIVSERGVSSISFPVSRTGLSVVSLYISRI